MTNGSGFDQKMLLMAARLAHEADLKSVLLSVLQELLCYMRAGESTEMNVEPVSLICCIIRVVLHLIADPAIAKWNTFLFLATTTSVAKTFANESDS